MNVLIIPEDFRNDQYVLKPILVAMLSRLGKKQANVQVCQDPLVQGISQATNWSIIEGIIDLYPMVQLFILFVDRDGVEGRRKLLDNMEKKAARKLSNKQIFLAENSWQECEVLTLAGHQLLPGWQWKKVRNETHPKEVYFLPFAASRGLLSEPGGGRKTLTLEAVRSYPAMRSKCPEDLGALERRINKWLKRH